MDNEHVVTIWKEETKFRLVGYIHINSISRPLEHSTLLSDVDIISIFGESFLANLRLFVEWPIRVVTNPTIYVQATQDILQNLIDARKKASMEVDNAATQILLDRNDNEAIRRFE